MDPDNEFTLTPEELAALEAALGNPSQQGGIPSWLQDAPNGQQTNTMLAGVPDYLSTRYAQAVKEYNDAWDEYQRTPPEQRSFTGVADRVKLAQSNVATLESRMSVYRPKQATPTKADTWQNPSDGSVTDLSTGRQLSGPIPGWVPGLGVTRPQQAPQRAPLYPWEAEAGQLGVEKAKLDLEKARAYPEEQAYERALKERELVGQESRWAQQYKNDRDQLASNLAQWWSSQRLQAAPFVMNPDWQGVPPGWQKNGPVNRLYDMAGAKYRETVLPQIQFNVDDAWRSAQAATGG